MPAIIHSVAELQGIRAAWAEAGESVALVPTMGSLHDGHAALVRDAQALADRIVVSIFVNPLQFAEGEDFERYPRSLAADEIFLAETRVDIIFAPDVGTMFPEGRDCAIGPDPGEVGDLFEGALRPGHFRGVLTVVKRLFDYVQPEVAMFGKKDAQQLFLVQSMVKNLGLPTRVVEVATVRDTDGLPLSSRNVYLSASERDTAQQLSRALRDAAQAPSPADALQMAHQGLAHVAGITLDYLDVVDPHTFWPVHGEEFLGEGLLIVAARVGGVRLLDNQLVHFGQ